jgi:hypothetical protein
MSVVADTAFDLRQYSVEGPERLSERRPAELPAARA